MTEDCVKSVNDMLAGILEYSRLDSGVIQPVIASVDLGGIVSRLAREYLPRAAKEGSDFIDTGIGIPADKQAEIFEEFRQLNNPARDSSQGVGLGLAIVSRLAGILEVEVSSQVGRGTRFSLLLP